MTPTQEALQTLGAKAKDQAGALEAAKRKRAAKRAAKKQQEEEEGNDEAGAGAGAGAVLGRTSTVPPGTEMGQDQLAI
jgi:hypothetical protein